MGSTFFHALILVMLTLPLVARAADVADDDWVIERGKWGQPENGVSLRM